MKENRDRAAREGNMMRTQLCELLGIAFPIIQAGMGPYTSPELVAAVSNAGGLGSIGAAGRTPAELGEAIARIRALSSRPFAINHNLMNLNLESFEIGLRAKPALISFAFAEPGDLVKRAHDAGIPVMDQVTTVRQAIRAAEQGVDIVNAQGHEAGGFGGRVGTLILIPQVVDAVRPTPVVASGGIADGRGLAAVLVLGAQGANVGTRFLMSEEARISDAHRQGILTAESEETVKMDVWTEIMPERPGDYGSTPRAVRSPFIDEWGARREDARREAERIRAELESARRAGRMHELLPFAGETAGLLHDVLPAAEIVRRLVDEAQRALELGGVLADMRLGERA
jgi:enoyl-[acyl-carrier protein] reductase II